MFLRQQSCLPKSLATQLQSPQRPAAIFSHVPMGHCLAALVPGWVGTLQSRPLTRKWGPTCSEQEGPSTEVPPVPSWRVCDHRKERSLFTLPASIRTSERLHWNEPCCIGKTPSAVDAPEIQPSPPCVGCRGRDSPFGTGWCPRKPLPGLKGFLSEESTSSQSGK